MLPARSNKILRELVVPWSSARMYRVMRWACVGGVDGGDGGVDGGAWDACVF